MNTQRDDANDYRGIEDYTSNPLFVPHYVIEFQIHYSYLQKDGSTREESSSLKIK